MNQVAYGKAVMSEFTDGMRAAAEWFDHHPEHEPSYNITYLPGEPGGSYDDSGNFVEATPEAKTAWLKECVKAFGSCDKKANGYSFNVVKNFGGGVRVIASAYGACRKISKGSHTEVVEEPVETTTRTKKVTKVVEDFEYECPPSLLSS